MLAKDAKLSDGSSLCREQAIEAICDHALAEYPNECIGVIDNEGIYHRLRNNATDPKKHATADKREIAQLIINSNLRALVHSHPGGPECPSEMDMISQQEMDVPFIIVATNGTACAEPFAWGDMLVDDRPLIGRSFRHATDDCYSLIRRWYKLEREIILPDFPRNWEWWNKKMQEESNCQGDLYRRFFSDAGFSELDGVNPREGDVWLAAIRSDEPNHAGIYLDNGLTIHHPSSGLAYDVKRLSKRDTIARWVPFITHWLRRK